MRAWCLSVFLLVACGGTGGSGDPDAGGSSSTDGGDETPTDGGSTPDAGAPPCEDDAEEDCEGSSEGNCTPGRRTCVEGVWSACEGRVQPGPGACDFPNCAGGENPGCTCRVGTTRECYDGPQDAPGKGPCVKGFQECVAVAGGSEWGPCRGQVVPSATDDCTGRDLDCDLGPPESGCTCTGSASRPCGGTTGGTCVLGTQTCTGGEWGACVGAVQPVPGDCANPSCAGGPNPGCECVIGSTESCYTGPFGTMELGTCSAGTRTCDGLGRWGPCVGQSRPRPVCDLESCTGSPAPGCE